ncbi:hypothetical protein L1049_028107 [Liquidambar formosana]|uniref:Uncharacterized protein n=1 Tax=Liquidambar formosana TaxID=63359 RepID=A0AAP0RJQ8_LIQFO
MEESKAAAYYDELTRKGEGAARFKQGLGFTSHSPTTTTTDAPPPARGSALPSSSSSFLSKFVKASNTENASDIQKQTQLHNIQNKLKKKPSSDEHQSRSDKSDRERHSRRRSRSRSRSGSRDRSSRHRHRSSSRDRDRDKERERRRDRERKRRRDRSSSPREKRLERSGGDGDRDRGVGKSGKERNGKVDYSRLIEGYDKMSPAERVKAKMKLQLSETVEKDVMKGMGSGWERFDFNKDAPLDDEEIEAAEDDVELVKHIGQSFRFSAVEARREEKIKAAHDGAMFGAPAFPLPTIADDEPVGKNNKKESNESNLDTNLISEKVLAKQQGSWRDRARKV